MASPVYGVDLVALTFAVVLAAAIVLLVSYLMPHLISYLMAHLADLLPPALGGTR